MNQKVERVTLEHYLEKFLKLRVNAARGDSPHKPCMLLAVIDRAEAGDLAINEIHYRPELLERFKDYFEVVRTETDLPNAQMPFSISEETYSGITLQRKEGLTF